MMLSKPSDHRRWLSCFITGASNFGCQYNFQSIAVVLLMMSVSQCTEDDGSCKQGDQAAWVEGSSSAIIFIGAIIGEIILGVLGDYIPRNDALLISLVISTISALLSAFASFGSPSSVYATIIICRFFLGTGVGGIFPLAAIKAYEDSMINSDKPDLMAAPWSYSWQMYGFPAPWLLALLMGYNPNLSYSFQWRFILAFGALFPFLAIIGLIIEKYKFGNSINVVQTDASKLSSKSVDELSLSSHLNTIIQELKSESNAMKLIGCGVSWFLFDIVVYGINLLGGYIIQAMADDIDDVSSVSHIRSVCKQAILATSMGIPATYVSLAILPYVGLKRLQIMGFGLMTITCMLMAICFEPLRVGDLDALFALYVIVSFSLLFGLGVSTFSMPAALFEKSTRSTFNGIAAAIGKSGAVVGAYALLPLASATSYSAVFGFCSAISGVGIIITAIYIHSKDLYKDDPEVIQTNLDKIQHIVEMSEKKFSSHDSTESQESINPMQVSGCSTISYISDVEMASSDVGDVVAKGDR